MSEKSSLYKVMDDIFGKPRQSSDLKEHTLMQKDGSEIVVEYFPHSHKIASVQNYIDWFGDWVYFDMTNVNLGFLRELQEQLDEALDSEG